MKASNSKLIASSFRCYYSSNLRCYSDRLQAFTSKSGCGLSRCTPQVLPQIGRDAVNYPVIGNTALRYLFAYPGRRTNS